MQTPPDICFSRIIPLNEQVFKKKSLYINDFLAKCRALVLMRFLTSFETCPHQFWWKRLIISTNFGGRGVGFPPVLVESSAFFQKNESFRWRDTNGRDGDVRLRHHQARGA